jgi:hypothetical protein
MFSLVKVQLFLSFLLYAEQAKKLPNLPHFKTSGDPHRSHFSSVICSVRLMSRIFLPASLSSSSKWS